MPTVAFFKIIMLSDLARVLFLVSLTVILSVVKPNVVLMSVAVPIHRLKQTQKKILKVHSHWRCLRRSHWPKRK